LWKQQILSKKNDEPEFYLPNGVCYWIPATALQKEQPAVKLLPLIAQGTVITSVRQQLSTGIHLRKRFPDVVLEDNFSR
jgi:hypothetical protein